MGNALCDRFRYIAPLTIYKRTEIIGYSVELNRLPHPDTETKDYQKADCCERARIASDEMEAPSALSK